MKTIIKFNTGQYRGQDVAGQEFELVEQFKTTANGGHVMVRNDGKFANCPDVVRVKVPGVTAYEFVSGHPPVAEPEGVINFTTVGKSDKAVAQHTDDELIQRICNRFEVLREMTKAVKTGTVRAMIVTGPPGVGKSFGVEDVLSKDDLFDMMGERKPTYEFVKGAMSAVGLYKKLYEFSKSKNTIVFDDCDSILLDDVALNILKAALDSGKKRTISWNTDSRLLRAEGVPEQFEFKGGAIFITNLKFENVRSKKLQDHLSALESRCHFIDLQMDTEREKVLRIKQIVFNPEAGQVGILDTYEFDDVVKNEVVDYIIENRSKMRELSLRTVLKVADLRKGFPNSWKEMSEVTVMKTAA
jgi:hypothetical protein